MEIRLNGKTWVESEMHALILQIRRTADVLITKGFSEQEKLATIKVFCGGEGAWYAGKGFTVWDALCGAIALAEDQYEVEYDRLRCRFPMGLNYGDLETTQTPESAGRDDLWDRRRPEECCKYCGAFVGYRIIEDSE